MDDLASHSHRPNAQPQRLPHSQYSHIIHTFTSNPSIKLGHDLDLSGPRDVIDDVIIQSAMGHLLLVGNWYQVSNSNRFRYICI